MKTDLATLFASQLESDGIGKDRIDLDDSTKSSFGRADEFERFRQAVRASSSSKLRGSVDCDDDLWGLTRIGVLLGDITLLTGTGPVGAICDAAHDDLCIKVSDDAFIQRVLIFYNRDVLRRWVEDAEPLIRDGRVFYEPSRSILHATVADVNVPVSELQISDGLAAELSPDDDDWSLTVERFNNLKNRSAATREAKRDWPRVGELVDIALPFIANTSLRTMYTLMQEQEDTLASFRAALVSVISAYDDELNSEASDAKIQRIGASIRRDIIEPQLESLTRSMKRIVQSRAIRIAGAALGTVAVGLTATAVQPLSATVQAVLGAGGLGVIAREYAEYRTEFLALKDNPWYFAWAVRKQHRVRA